MSRRRNNRKTATSVAATESEHRTTDRAAFIAELLREFPRPQVLAQTAGLGLGRQRPRGACSDGRDPRAHGRREVRRGVFARTLPSVDGQPSRVGGYGKYRLVGCDLRPCGRRRGGYLRQPPPCAQCARRRYGQGWSSSNAAATCLLARGVRSSASCGAAARPMWAWHR